MVAVDGHREVTSANSAVDLKRSLAGPLSAEDLKLEHGLDLAPSKRIWREASPSPLDPIGAFFAVLLSLAPASAN